jgi:hypothetical protein
MAVGKRMHVARLRRLKFVTAGLHERGGNPLGLRR